MVSNSVGTFKRIDVSLEIWRREGGGGGKGFFVFVVLAAIRRLFRLLQGTSQLMRRVTNEQALFRLVAPKSGFGAQWPAGVFLGKASA